MVSYNKMRIDAFVSRDFLCWLLLSVCLDLYLVGCYFALSYNLIQTLFGKHLHFLREMLGCFQNIGKQSIAAD